jgi:hypothetical protein
MVPTNSEIRGMAILRLASLGTVKTSTTPEMHLGELDRRQANSREAGTHLPHRTFDPPTPSLFAPEHASV